MNPAADSAFREVFESIFSRPAPFGLEEAAKVLGHGLDLPKERKPCYGKEPVYIAENLPLVTSLHEMEKKYEEIMRLLPKKKISSVKDLEKLMDDPSIFCFCGNKFLNSQECEKSDNYYNSTHVYLSRHITDSKFIGFSTHLVKCEYMYGARDTTNSSLCIRTQDSNYLNNCYEVSWSAKTSNSLFCHAVVNVRHCMFCFHIASNEYCIANRKYTKEEYEKAYNLVVDALIDKGFKLPFFPVV